MKRTNPFVLMIMIALGFALVFTLLPANTIAQAEKDQKEKRVEDDDDDDELTDADKRTVKFSLSDARKIALERVAGTVVDEELEKENGRLQYAFDIRTSDGKLFDVEINAVTGEVLQAEEEADDDDDNDAAAKKLKAKSAKQQKLNAKAVKPAKPKTNR